MLTVLTPIAATCATIAGALNAAQGGEKISLNGDCPKITVSRRYAKPVTVDARGATVRGLVISGGNIDWYGGRIVAPAGAFANGPDGYGLLLRGGTDVRIRGALLTSANRGVVLDNASRIVIADNSFIRIGQDGIIATASQGVQILRNRFAQTLGKPTECQVKSDLRRGLSKRDCVQRGGTWKDGFHADAVQLRNGMRDVLVAFNTVEGATQGLSQMDKRDDAPLTRIRIDNNVIETDGPHKATLTNCIDCSVTRNTIRRPKGSNWKAVILKSEGITYCGNVTERPEPNCR